MTYPEFTAERERDLDTFVSNNIIACLSLLFYDIGQHPEAGAQDHGGAGGETRLAGENGGDDVLNRILLHELHLVEGWDEKWAHFRGGIGREKSLKSAILSR